ncbi:hypothetical protein GCM10027056_11740 [Glaciibacter psychrotolerans]
MHAIPLDKGWQREAVDALTSSPKPGPSNSLRGDALAAVDANTRGFPRRVRVAKMTSPERAAYWLYWSRRHESRGDRFLMQLHDIRDALHAGDTPAAFALVEDLPRKNQRTATTSNTNP